MAAEDFAPVVAQSKPAASASKSRPQHALVAFALSPKYERLIVLLIIVVQAVWAIAIPVKNVVMMTNPEFRADSISTDSADYTFLPSENTTVVIPGKTIVPLLRDVLRVVLGQRMIRENFEAAGAFDLDSVYQLLSPEDFHVIAQYYAVLFQTTEFPGSVMTPRAQHFDTKDIAGLPQDALGVWIKPTDTTMSNRFVRLSCSPRNAKLAGMRCRQSGTPFVCYDFPVKGAVRDYEPVSFDGFREATGLANNIGQLNLIEVFHSTMAALFSTRDWKKTLDAIQFSSNPDIALANAFASVYGDDGRPMILERFVDAFNLPLSVMNTTNLESCEVSEIFSSRFYTKAFALQLIQTALNEYGLYNSVEIPMHPPSQTDAIVAPVLEYDLFITSGVRYDPMSYAGSRSIVGVTVASMTTAATRFKLDKKLDGTQESGSSVRMLQFMASYPEYYSYERRDVQKTAKGTAFDAVAYSVLGSSSSGLNTFKASWWANTMGVFRLRELPADPANTTRAFDKWWDDEAKIARWFANLERSSDAPFHLFDKYLDIAPQLVVINDNPVTACHRAFFRSLTKVAYLSILSFSQVPSYAVFMSNTNGGAAPWFKTMMLRTELYGETIAGGRYAFTFSSDDTTRRDDGSAWVSVPILDAMLRNFGRDESLRMLTDEYNKSFVLLVATEYGKLHFTDTSHCAIGFTRLNVSSADNTREKITEKLYASVGRFFGDLLDATPALYARMKSELNSGEGVPMVSIRDELIKGSPAGPAIEAVMGSPVFWTPTAFTAGILKLWPKTPVPTSVIEAYRNATTCYATLELRYLNESVRCWVEPNNVRKIRVEQKSVLMAKIVFSIWSTSLVLNAIAAFIAVSFVKRLVAAWRLTRFRCVNIWVALQLNFQGFGVLSFAQTVLLSLSTVPLLIGYHIPVDNTFIVNQGAQQHMSKLFKDVIVTMSASWFFRLGFEVANHFVALQQVSYWFSNFRLRLLSALLVFIVRFATPDRMHSTAYEMAKFALTISGMTLLGVCCAAVPTRRQAHPIAMIAPMEAKRQNVVIASIVKHGMPLNKFGLIGFSRQGWSLAGLVVEGWQVVRHRTKNQLVAVKGICRIPLAVDDKGEIKSLL